MIVDGIGRESVARTRRIAPRAGFGGELARADGEGATPAAGPEGAPAGRVLAAGGVAGAAAMAAPDAVEERDARARREADQLLRGLRQVQLALLGHGRTGMALEADAAAAPADPGLQALLRAVRVRAAIEGFRQQGGS